VPGIERIYHLLDDPNVSDVLIHSAIKCLVERDGILYEVDKMFTDEAECQNWIQKLFAESGGRVDFSQPIGDVSLETEHGLLRVHAVLAGDCSELTQISIRRHAVQHLELQDLVSKGFLTSTQKEKVIAILRAKQNFVIVGGTGSGKTTLLRSMLSEVHNERIVTIEENYELRLQGNAVALKTRENNHEGVGAISLSRLLTNALRMRPDRIVIGEARGEELMILLQSLNTGHAGAGFTLHANSYKDAYSRMLSILSFVGIQNDIARTLIDNSIQWVIEVKRLSSGRSVVAIERFSSNV
jgi:pilus assembly protein CpaF